MENNFGIGAIATFGEVMARISVQNNGYVFRQSLPGTVELTFGGAEANVAASLSILGRKTAFITALPETSIADACIGFLQNLGVDTSNIKKTNEGRLGLYFIEAGANQRPSKVIYDRSHSSISLAAANEFDWDTIFQGTHWFHISGITPALSKSAAEISIEAVKTAKQKGITVSCDLNFRKKLWNWDPNKKPLQLAREIMPLLLRHVDIIVGNEEDAEDIIDIKAGKTHAESGTLDVEKYPEAAHKICELYPQISKIAFTLRESISATHNRWGAMLYDSKINESVFAPTVGQEYRPYEIQYIIDRIGGGDAFAAGLIFALTDSELSTDNQQVIEFATAASCLCHSIYGDINFSKKSDVLRLMKGDTRGRVKR